MFSSEIPVILNTTLELETYIKRHHVYRKVWTPEVGKKLNVLMEPDNRDAVCVDKDQTVVGHLKKGGSGKFAKTIFFSSEVVPTVTVMLKFQGNDAT